MCAAIHQFMTLNYLIITEPVMWLQSIMMINSDHHRASDDDILTTTEPVMRAAIQDDVILIITELVMRAAIHDDILIITELVMCAYFTR